MLKISKLDIAKKKILELNKKYTKKSILEDSSNESSINVDEKERLIKSNDEYLNSSTENIELDNQNVKSSEAPNLFNKSKYTNKFNSQEASNILHSKMTIVADKETGLSVDVERKTNEARNLTPTGVSKRLANVFICSSSDEEELSEDINVDQIIDRAKSYTSTSARTVSEDIISEDGNKKTPRSIKFVRIDTPILAVQQPDESIQTRSTISDEQNLSSFIALNEISMSKQVIENKKSNLKDKSEASKSKSNSISSNSSITEFSSHEKSEELIHSYNTTFSNSASMQESEITDKYINDVMASSNTKSKKVFRKSKGIQTELNIKTATKPKYNKKENSKINLQGRPTLQTSVLYRFSDMTDAEINYVCSKFSNVCMEEFSEEESNLSTELLVQQFLKQQVVIIRHLVESHHQLYLNYCKSVQQMCKFLN